jgi:energy-coupling factor transporter ATP-binding protein EcfA2
MNATAYERLFELLEGSELSQDAVEVVLAAADGAVALLAQLEGGERATRAPEDADDALGDPPQVYLEEISVEGFRGVGPRAKLQFEPAAGLTLVVGRNGSGKSSFAEALEVLLTGTTLRWEERTRVWREGWRNLHHDGATEIAARFRIDGEAEALAVSRRWGAGDTLEAGEQLKVNGARSSWAELGWERPLEQFRPILSYNELGTMFSTRAAALYEALSAVLGLEDFDAAANVLRQERLAREKTSKEEKQVRGALLQPLNAVDDERAVVILEQFDTRTPDIDEVSRLVESEVTDSGSDARALATLEVPAEDALNTRCISWAAALASCSRPGCPASRRTSRSLASAIPDASACACAIASASRNTCSARARSERARWTSPVWICVHRSSGNRRRFCSMRWRACSPRPASVRITATSFANIAVGSERIEDPPTIASQPSRFLAGARSSRSVMTCCGCSACSAHIPARCSSSSAGKLNRPPAHAG